MRKLIFSSVVAASMLATASFASIANDGTGEFLVAPAYYAKDGFSTKLKLVNTSDTYSYIYRVALREYMSSEEFDFVVILSPLDVWEGTIYEGAAKSVMVSSSDDSNYVNSEDGAFTVDASGHFNSNLGTAKKARDFTKGYVEFYPIAAYDEGANKGKPIPKKVLKERFKELVSGSTAAAGGDIIKDGITTNYDVAPALIQNQNGGVNNNAFVAGFATISNSKYKAVMTMPMTAFEDVNDLAGVNTAVGFGTDATPTAYLGATGVDKVLNDLNLKEVTIPYETHGKNDGLYFTFWGDGHGQGSDKCTQKRGYGAYVRDMKENGKDLAVPTFSPVVSATHNIECEFASLPISSLLSKAGVATDAAFAKGLVKVHGLANVTSNQTLSTAPGIMKVNPSAIVTYMSAVEVEENTPSYSWTYAPVLR